MRVVIITGRNMFEGKRDAAQSFDFNPRFLADASRELRRAWDWYLYLKENNL
jgi:hypothetical protein